MYATNLTYLFLLWVSCSRDGLRMVVTAQPTVSAWIVTPEADRKEGESVDMKCVAMNVNDSRHIVEWRTEDPPRILRWGTGDAADLSSRFMFMTAKSGEQEITQDFTINPLQRGDADEYVCNVHEIFVGGSSAILVSARVTLSVLYFPNESFPICSPDGPITVDIGTELNMRCSSEGGNSAVMMTVSENTARCDTYMWTKSTMNDRIERSMNLTVAAADDNTSFQCTISSVYYPNMTRTCSIGPIHVTGATGSPARCSTVATSEATTHTLSPASNTTLETKNNPSSSLQTPLTEENKLCSCVPWIAAFVVSFILLVLACFIITLLILRNFKLKRLIANLNQKAAAPPKSDPYMELQPTDDRNREYMEPETRETTTVQHTYYQTIEAEKEQPEDDYEVTDDNTKYDTVGATKNEEKKYQNIEH